MLLPGGYSAWWEHCLSFQRVSSWCLLYFLSFTKKQHNVIAAPWGLHALAWGAVPTRELLNIIGSPRYYGNSEDWRDNTHYCCCCSPYSTTSQPSSSINHAALRDGTSLILDCLLQFTLSTYYSTQVIDKGANNISMMPPKYAAKFYVVPLNQWYKTRTRGQQKHLIIASCIHQHDTYNSLKKD